jgi:hypothetical protein
MSMSLYVWKLPRVIDEDEAQRLVDLEDESVFEPSEDLRRFYEELVELFPPPESLTGEELDAGATPWADGVEASDRLVWLSIRWGADGDDLDTMVELARKYDLVMYDPQGPSFHSPADENEGVPYVPSAGEYVRGLLLTAFGVLFTYVAWKLSIPVLSWLLMFVGGFVAFVAAFSTVAVAYAGWRARSTPAP